MSGVGDGKSPIQKTPVNTQGSARVDLVKMDFETLIQNKGYDVYHEKAVKCPCHVKNDGNPLSNCRNCGGSGWVFINKVETRMVLMGINIDTKFKEWSEEKLGTVKVSARDCDQLAFMDRITVIDGEVTTSQVIYPRLIDGSMRAKTIYSIKEVQEIFSYNGPDQKLRLLTEGAAGDYTIENNILVLSEEFNDVENLSISVRYTHAPQFHIIDLQRETMVTRVKDKENGGSDIDVLMPISAVARRTHYVLDEQNFTGDYLFDNTYDPGCNPGAANPSTCSPVVILRSDGEQLTVVNPGQEYQLEASQILQAVQGGPNQFIQFLHPGEDYVLPIIVDATVTTDGGGTPVASLGPGETYDIPLHTISDTDANVLYTHTFDTNAVINDCTVSRVNGDGSIEVIQTILAEGSYTFKRITIEDEFAFTGVGGVDKNILVANGVVLSLTETATDIKINLQDPAPATVQSSGGTINENIDSGDTLILPDTTHIQSDGTPTPTETGVPFICTPAPTIELKPKRIHHPPPSATVPYNAGDYVDLYYNSDLLDPFGYEASSGYTEMKLGADQYTLHADNPNPWGNPDRYTDTDGNPGNINPVRWSAWPVGTEFCICDWYHKIMVYGPNLGNFNWVGYFAAIAANNTAVFKGFDNWKAFTIPVVWAFLPEKDQAYYHSTNPLLRNAVSGYSEIRMYLAETREVSGGTAAQILTDSAQFNALAKTSTSIVSGYMFRFIQDTDTFLP